MSKAEPAIAKYMTTQPYFIDPGASLADAALVMKERGIRHLPVVKGGRIVGLLSDRDIKLVSAFEEIELKAIAVTDACVAKPYVVEPETPLSEVTEEMASKHYGSAIVAQNGKLVGIFTTVDACRALSVILRARFHA